MNEQTLLVNAENIQVDFKTEGGIAQAVRDVSFKIYKGQTVALVGESGSGKSISARVLMVTVHRDCVDNNNSCGIG